ncbi:FkbM family methyltransferase [Novosphingobium hassiacum]|uniref:FkbM family methyltransferase n=1 Tax=Novosphingobium hassiacum TaxID=173676 RepID=A0A7W5ZX26_9SPHN|nr:FkbM family methyltransferase [Novosphingobium hassiacum]MBB3859410.1 FkbM family methyltransferase [Novosphingobium hassiacum]
MTSKRIISIHTTATITGVSEGDSYIEIVEGQFEKRFQQLFEKYLPENAVVFDIGANIGLVSIIAAKIRPGSRVYSFEAGAHVCEVLKENVANNYLSNVFPQHCAVADFDGSISFIENSAYGHAVEGGSSNDDGSTVAVPCFRIDSLVQKFSPQGVDLIKLDIEGFEPQALKGAIATISDFDPVFLMEINPWCIENYGKVDFKIFCQEIFAQFKFVYIINKNWHEEHPIRPINFDELMGFIDESESLFVDDLVFCNSPKLCTIAEHG